MPRAATNEATKAKREAIERAALLDARTSETREKDGEARVVLLFSYLFVRCVLQTINECDLRRESLSIMERFAFQCFVESLCEEGSSLEDKQQRNVSSLARFMRKRKTMTLFDVMLPTSMKVPHVHERAPSKVFPNGIGRRMHETERERERVEKHLRFLFPSSFTWLSFIRHVKQKLRVSSKRSFEMVSESDVDIPTPQRNARRTRDGRIPSYASFLTCSSFDDVNDVRFAFETSHGHVVMCVSHRTRVLERDVGIGTFQSFGFFTSSLASSREATCNLLRIRRMVSTRRKRYSEDTKILRQDDDRAHEALLFASEKESTGKLCLGSKEEAKKDADDETEAPEEFGFEEVSFSSKRNVRHHDANLCLRWKPRIPTCMLE